MGMNGSAMAVRRKCMYVSVSYCTSRTHSSVQASSCDNDLSFFLFELFDEIAIHTSLLIDLICFNRIQASKQLTIHKTPNVLVIHLKRFSYGGVSGKISKNVTFDFSMSVPCTGSPGVAEKVPYSLIGIVVHHGSSIHSGHYVAFVKVSQSYLCSTRSILF